MRALPWYPAGVSEGTKELTATVCWVATALLACQAQNFVASRSHLRPDQAELVEQMVIRCRSAWDYAVPEASLAREELRSLCQRALPFFNEYAVTYGRFAE